MIGSVLGGGVARTTISDKETAENAPQVAIAAQLRGVCSVPVGTPTVQMQATNTLQDAIAAKLSSVGAVSVSSFGTPAHQEVRLGNALASGNYFTQELFGDVATKISGHLSQAGSEVTGKSYVQNFLQVNSNCSSAVSSHQLKPVHQSQILSRICVSFNQFMNQPEQNPPSPLDTIRADLKNRLPLDGGKIQALQQHLAEMALQNDQGEPLYTNKLLKPEHLVLEFPGDAATPKNNEPETNAMLVKQLGFPDYVLDRTDGKHETYALHAFTNAQDQSVTLGELFGGALQGCMRIPVNTHSQIAADHPGWHNPAAFSSGGHAFDVSVNENVVKNNIGKLGEDIINFAVNINLDNQAMPGMEGFTAGISGNALHYVIQTAKYCQSVNIPFNFEQTLEVCRDHLVGDSIQQPMHHSLPEVMQGAYIAKMLIDKGVISEKGSQMNQEQMLGALQGAVAEANDKVRILQQTVYAYA